MPVVTSSVLSLSGIPARQLSFMQRTDSKKMTSPSIPMQKPVNRAFAGRWLQPKAMESSCAMGAPSVAMLISTSTVRMSFSLLRPICRVWMPRRFCASILAK